MKFKQILTLAVLIIGDTLLADAQIAQLPLKFNEKHLYIKLQTKQNDTLNFIFDTGATGATIDSTAAERMGIGKKDLQDASIAGSGGVQSYKMAVHQELKLDGGIKLKDLNLVIVNFASLSANLGSKIDGIIGYEILDQYVTKIDFDQKKIQLYGKINAIDTAGYTAIPFEFSKNIVIPRFPISVTLNNGETFTGKVMFDTGNAFSLIVSTPFSKYHDFNSKLGLTAITQGRGMNAITQDQLANIKAMSFAGFNFGSMSIRLTINDKAEPKDGYLGILGIEIIKRFNVILDYANKRIYLKPNSAYNDKLALETIDKNLNDESIIFLNKNRKRPGVKVTSTGLQYEIIKNGTGIKPTMDDRVSLNFSTKLFTGEKLWSTYDNKKPWVHHLDKALEGVREAALMMPVGSKWILYIPASLAFGAGGYEEVPPGAALIYEMEVLKIEK